MLIAVPIILYLILMLFIAFQVNKKSGKPLILQKNTISEAAIWAVLCLR